MLENSNCFIYNCKGGQEYPDPEDVYDYSYTNAVRAQSGSVVHVAGNTKPWGSYTYTSGAATINISSSATSTDGLATDGQGDPIAPLGHLTAPVDVSVSPAESVSNTYGTSILSSSGSIANTDAARTVKNPSV